MAITTRHTDILQIHKSRILYVVDTRYSTYAKHLKNVVHDVHKFLLVPYGLYSIPQSIETLKPVSRQSTTEDPY